jgi:histidinol-phosphate/aromatic aminotransferase/cobyric acid decarboxylase-like protein
MMKNIRHISIYLVDTFCMKHPSVYLDWYVHVPRLRYDLRSSGLSFFPYDINLSGVDLSANYPNGNPETVRLLADYYHVQPENVFVSSEGASGQNARIIRVLAENLRGKGKNEALVEFPTYEPLLRHVQEHFRTVRRFERKKEEGYGLDLEAIREAVTARTGLLVLTNPHAPSGAVADRRELAELVQLSDERGFFVVCDEIYAEFNRALSPSLFSISSERAIVTTSFSKAFGLGGLKLGTALASKDLVSQLYSDVLNTVGNSSNLVQIVAGGILANDQARLHKHVARWSGLKREMEEWLDEHSLQYIPNKVSVTYWVESPIEDTYKWTDEVTIKKNSLAAVPGAFFLFKEGSKIVRSNMLRLGLGAINPETHLWEALEILGKALKIP